MRVDELKKSHTKVGPLYPILVDKEGIIIDGFHRKRVSKKWPKHKLEWVDGEVEREKIALIANITRREIRGSEISERLGKLAKLTGWTPQKIASEVGRSYDWVIKYIPQRYKDKIKRRKRKRGHSNDFDGHHTANFFENVAKELFVSNVWSFEESRPDYGDMNFHGNTNPSLIAQCLLKYAPSKGIVLDPMAGSGTTIDLCRELGLKIKAYDIHPLRDDIEFGDAENLNLEDGCIDFIFAHWPYWKKVIYSEHPDDLSSQSLKRFYEKTKGIMQEMYRLLKKNRFFALLIGDHRHNGGLVDLSSHLSIIGSKRFKLFDKIIFLAKGQRSKRLGTESTTNKWRAKKHNYHLIDADVLLIFKKEAS